MSTRVADGTVGSASQVKEAFTELRTQGQTAINQLVVLRENTLLLFNNALSELNGKRVRVNRLPEVGIAAKFVTSDLQDINQPITTASLRGDSNSYSLRERAAPGEAIIASVRFSASQGTIQALQVPQTGSSGNLGVLYRVATTGPSVIPVGTFDIQLVAPVALSLIIFDMMDTPSSATVQASISQNGINYTNAASVTRNGYRLAGWFQPQEIQFIRITVTPAMPDTLGGSLFTFGLTDLHAFSVQYHLRSDVYTNQLEIVPRSASLEFSTPTVSGLTFFLSLAGQPAFEVFPGSIVPIPGVTSFSNASVGLTAPTGTSWAALTPYAINQQVIDNNGNLQTVVAISGSGTSGASHPTWSINGGTTIDNPGGNQIIWQETASAPLSISLPSNVYLSTLEIVDNSSHLAIRTAPGLARNSVGMNNQYFVVNTDGTIDLTIYNHAVDQTRTFTVTYLSGPATVTAALQVELTTPDLNLTPIYSGANLIEV